MGEIYRRSLRAGERFDDWCSYHSQPVRVISEAAERAWPVGRIEIPRRIWSVLQRHPVVMSVHQGLRVIEQHSQTCKECGAARATFRPPLDSKVFGLILNGNADGPILPDAVVITEYGANEVRLYGTGIAVIADVLDLTNTSRYGESA